MHCRRDWKSTPGAIISRRFVPLLAHTYRIDVVKFLVRKRIVEASGHAFRALPTSRILDDARSLERGVDPPVDLGQSVLKQMRLAPQS